jgi:hypothetical protein
MKARFAFFCALTYIVAPAFVLGQAQVLIPDSTVEHSEDAGKKAHTNHLTRPSRNQTG